MGFFPFYTDIENKKCLVVGGGKVALRKVQKLLPFSPEITVIAPLICEELLLMENIKIIKRKFMESDIDSAFMVIGAADDSRVNGLISELCMKRNIPVNIVDEPRLCSFYFPSIVRKNNITVGISTEGKSPVLARFLREKIEMEIDGDILRTAELLSFARTEIRKIYDTETMRKNAVEDIFKMCLDGRITNINEIEKYIRDLQG
ncbi:MAG: bifunctional precorrin-2 dehydrogenase/sirohydrochlorin ferrochelatase [Ruminococcus sp.]